MAHRLAPAAEAGLDDIWFHIAKESQSFEIADRVVDSITDRFLLLATHPHIGRRRDEDLRPGLRSFPWASTSLFIGSKMTTCRSSTLYAAAATLRLSSVTDLSKGLPPKEAG